MKLHSTLCALAALALTAGVSAQQIAFDATVTACGPTGDTLATLPIDLEAARDVLGWELADEGWGARVTDARTGEQAVSQTHFSDGRARVTWLVPGEYADGESRSYRVTLGVAPAAGQAERISVERTAEEVLVRTPWFVAHHNLSAGGTLGTVEFASGLTLPMRMNDRLYNEGVGQFYLVGDPEPEVEVLSEGPLQVVVRTTARYCLGDGTPAPGEPRATYEFAYTAFSPTVQMRASVTQEGGANWDQVHVFEMYHKTEAPVFDTVAWGPPTESVAFVDEHNTHSLRSEEWGALLTGEEALALIGSDLYGIHTGLSGHGVYVHGPWHTFRGGEANFEATLYLGPSGGSAEALAGRLERLASRWEVTVRVPELEDGVRLLREALQEFGEDDAAGWLRSVGEWLADDAARAAGSLTGLRDWQEALRTGASITERPDAAADASPIIRMDESTATLAGDGLILRLTRDGRGIHLSQAGRFGATNASFIAPGAETGELWALTFSRGTQGEQVIVRPADAQRTEWEAEAAGGAAELRLRWLRCDLGENADAVDVTVGVRVDRESKLSEWSIAWESRAEGFGIWEIDFPRVAGIGPGGEVCVPSKWGTLYQVPMPGSGWRSTYPSGGAFTQMMCWWRDGMGLYCAAHDPDAGVKQPRALNGAGGTIDLGFTIQPPGMGVPAARGDLGYEVAVGAFDGDWFDAGKIYRVWALQQFWTRKGPIADREDVAQWWKDCALSIRPTGDPDFVTEMGTKLQAAFGMEAVLHWYVWHQIPFDNDYPEYFPVKPGFGEAVQALQDVGVHVMPYVNGHLWDTDTASWEAENGFAGAALRPDGSLYIEGWQQQEHAVMCPAAPKWEEKMLEIATRLAGEYGTDGVYLDQIGAAAPRLCFSEEHGHPVGGGGFWSRGYDALLAEMREQCRALNPNFIITTESHAEPYIAGLDGHLMCNLVGANQVPLYTAIYGGYTQTFGRLGEVENPVAFRMEHGQAFAFGSIMGRINTLLLLEPENAELLAYLKSLAEIRRDYREFMAFGEMLRPPRIEEEIPDVTTQWLSKTSDFVTLPAIQASAWRARDGRVGFFYTNISEEDVSFEHAIDLFAYGVLREEGVAQLETRMRTFNAREEREPELDTTGERYVVRHTLSPMETMAVEVE